MSEPLNKLDPQRTIYLRGSDGYGAMATIVNASASGFTLKGVFERTTTLRCLFC